MHTRAHTHTHLCVLMIPKQLTEAGPQLTAQSWCSHDHPRRKDTRPRGPWCGAGAQGEGENVPRAVVWGDSGYAGEDQAGQEAHQKTNRIPDLRI